MPRKPLVVLPLQHTNDGCITLLINGKEYNYWCDNAKVIRFKKLLWKKSCNKGKLLSIFKRDAILLREEV